MTSQQTLYTASERLEFTEHTKSTVNNDYKLQRYDSDDDDVTPSSLLVAPCETFSDVTKVYPYQLPICKKTT